MPPQWAITLSSTWWVFVDVRVRYIDCVLVVPPFQSQEHHRTEEEARGTEQTHHSRADEHDPPVKIANDTVVSSC